MRRVSVSGLIDAFAAVLMVVVIGLSIANLVPVFRVVVARGGF